MIFLSETSSLRPFLALGALALLLALEWWIPFRGLVQSKLRHVTTNLTIAGTNAVVVHLLLGGPLLLWSQVVKTEGWGLLHQLGMGPLSNILASVVLFDLVFYGAHWANHKVPFLWRFHRAHHSDLALDVTTAVRFHLGEVLISTGIKAGGITALGISPLGLVLFEMTLLAAAQFQHSNLGLPGRVDTGIRLMIVTPHMHWIHHSRRPHEHNSNFGTISSVWDRLFGTYFMQVRQAEIQVGLNEYSWPEQVGLLGFSAMPFRGGCRPGRSGY